MIYIQSKIVNNSLEIPYHFDSACAMYGAIETAQDFKLKSFELLQSGILDPVIKKNLFVGSTEFMREVFRRVGLTDVRLPRNSNRESQIMTLGEALEISKSKEIFIKPYEIKEFPATVLDGCNYSYLKKVPRDSLVFVYEPFESEISSEWRIYVDNNQILDSRNYSGDFTIKPDYLYVDRIIKENKKLNFPKTYTIDIGILENRVNVVIEYNDMWAIGNYGIPNDLYLKALKNRYVQIMQTIK